MDHLERVAVADVCGRGHVRVFDETDDAEAWLGGVETPVA
jgi:hypothetical protein